MRLSSAAIIAIPLAAVTACYPVSKDQQDAGQQPAAQSDQGRSTAPDRGGVARPDPSQHPGSKPTVPRPAAKPTVATPKPVPLPRPQPLPATAAALGVGPRMAGRCSGVPIRPGQDPQALVNSRPAGTTFCFAAGLHRIIQTIRPKAGTTLASSARAVLTGSVRLTTWTQSGARWITRGPLPAAYGQSGQCEDSRAHICHLREQLFVNGAHQRRVATLSQVRSGTFFADYGKNVVYLGMDPRGRTVEMSRTPTAIESGARGVTVRGLTIEHFASAPQSGALVAGPGWRVAANEIRWNKSVGVMLVNADRTVVERNVIRHNGQLGLGQYSSERANVTRNQIAYNNTDGFWIADWESGGMKSTRSSGNVTLNIVHDNRGVGVWCDVADSGRYIGGNRIQRNAADGIRYEISRNGLIDRNTITGNGYGTGRGSGTSLWDGGGININTSSNIVVRHNTVTGNVNGISIQSRARGNGPWGRYLLRNVRVAGNLVAMGSGSQSTGVVQNAGAELPAGALVFVRNRYLLDRLTAPRFGRFGQMLNATGWRRAGFDRESSFTIR